MKPLSVCPKCNSKYVKYFGAGTEKIEQEIKLKFKGARTIRMDADTTKRKEDYEKIYESFKNGNADILIGTQMIAKGLDFKNVTLVGVIAADLTLNLPDYRASERTFQLISQVAGRAGRGSKEGKVIIQTYSPENLAIRAAAANDYLGFYDNEISMRKIMEYPPFTKLLLINMGSKKEDELIKYSEKIGLKLKVDLNNFDKIKMLGPCPSVISKIKEVYRWHILLKGEITIELAENIKKSIHEILKSDYNEIRVSLDINPVSLL
jgi:primosomal protein N' (replication factor Y)